MCVPDVWRYSRVALSLIFVSDENFIAFFFASVCLIVLVSFCLCVCLFNCSNVVVLIKGITPKICRLYFVLINSEIFICLDFV